MKRVNAVIVGAGAAGCVVAKELATAGLSVVVFERGPWYTAHDCRKDDLRNQCVTELGNAFGPDDEGNPRVLVDPKASPARFFPAREVTTTTRPAWAAEPSATAHRPGASCRGTSACAPPTARRKAARSKTGPSPTTISSPSTTRPSYDGPRKLKISADPRQGVCYQCHAPRPPDTNSIAAAAGWKSQAGSGDDRTPLGVHEGLSCVACHNDHNENARASCATCHPALFNCGRDVEKMDTTFADPKSPHNIHWVKCADCHEHGIPHPKTHALAQGE